MSGLFSRPPVIAIILFASLAINLFLGGFLFARGMYGHERLGPISFRGNPNLHASEALKKFHAGFREHRDDMKNGYLAFRQAREDVRRAMNTEPFDADALQRALDKMRDATNALQSVSHEVLISVSAELNPKERRDLLEALNMRFSGPGAVMGTGRGTGRHTPPKGFGPPPFERPLTGMNASPPNPPEENRP